MHEAKHGELKSEPGGKGGKVKSRKQAIAIALHEAGESKYDTPSQRRRSAAKTRSKEAGGRTGQQEREDKSHVGARGAKESTPAMRRKAPSRTSASLSSASRSKSKSSAGKMTRSQAAAKAGRASARARAKKSK